MQLVGEIVRLQVQTSSLKVGEATRRRYDPTAIHAVPELILGGDGVTGVSAWEERIEDVHNRTHPGSKNRGINGVSVLFTGHYAAMRERFGDHLGDGIAGENILIAFAGLLGADDVAAGLIIETDGGRCIELARVMVATPCVEFGRYALQFPDGARPDRRVTDAVAFLADGMRGYYAGYDGEPATIRVGDRVYVR